MQSDNKLSKINTSFSNCLVLINDNLNFINQNYKELAMINNIRELNQKLRNVFYRQDKMIIFDLQEIKLLQENIKNGNFNTNYNQYINYINKTFKTDNEQIKYKINDNKINYYNYNKLEDSINNREHLSTPVFSYSLAETNIYYFIDNANIEIKKLRENKEGNLKLVFEYIYGAISLLIIKINDDIRFYEGKDRCITESFRAYIFGWFSRLSRHNNSYASTARELKNIINFYIDPLKTKPINFITSYNNIYTTKNELDKAIKSFTDMNITQENISICRGRVLNIDKNLHALYKTLLINKE